MSQPPRDVIELVRALGPLDTRAPAILTDDEHERFPEEATALLHAGVLEYLIPHAYGGKMEAAQF